MKYSRSPAPGYVAHRTLTEPRCQRLVAGELAGAQVLGRHGVAEAARGVELQPVVEHEEANLRSRHRVVPVHDRVDHGLEHRAFMVLRNVAAGRPLPSGDAPVADHELHRISYLAVERSTDVQRVELAIAVLAGTVVADGVDEGVREPLPRVGGGKQHAADRGPKGTVSIVLDELQLGQGDLGRIVRARARVALP